MTTRKEALEAAVKALYPWRRSEVLKVIRALDASGWQCVPKTATEEMLTATVFGPLSQEAWERVLSVAPKLTVE